MDLKNKYITPQTDIVKYNTHSSLNKASKPKWNDVSSYGFGDKDDYDREGDDNWDDDWSWGKNNEGVSTYTDEVI